MADPCGGNSRGGSGCSCDPPFGRVEFFAADPIDYGVCRFCGSAPVLVRIANGNDVEMRRLCPTCDRG